MSALAPPLAQAPPAVSSALSLIACVRDPEDSDHNMAASLPGSASQPPPPADGSKRRRFHPFRGLRRMFRRKTRTDRETEPTSTDVTTAANLTTNGDSAARSLSASELLSDQPTKGGGSSTGPLSSCQGLSVSHDSVFTAEAASTSSDLDTNQSTSSLSVHHAALLPGRIRAELATAVRGRRHAGGGGRGGVTSGVHGVSSAEDSEEDLGLPRSPPAERRPAASLATSLKDGVAKSHSTCSDGSLLSMGSSEMDEDSFGSSKASLSALPQPTVSSPSMTVDGNISSTISSLLDGNANNTISSADLSAIGVSGTPLSHSAARHKMAVRPKRTHGKPQRHRVHQLPTTPEVNEEMSARSLSPEATTISTETVSCVKSASLVVPADVQLRSASLPPGLALSTAMAASTSLPRSHSNVTQPQTTTDNGNSSSGNFFGRFLSRHSGKKSRISKENIITDQEKDENDLLEKFQRLEKGRSIQTRNSASLRQRIEPIQLPPSPELIPKRQHISSSPPLPPSPPKPTWPASLMNLENREREFTSLVHTPILDDVEINEVRRHLNKSRSFRGEDISPSHQKPPPLQIEQQVPASPTNNSEISRFFTKNSTASNQSSPCSKVQARSEAISPVKKSASLDSINSLRESPDPNPSPSKAISTESVGQHISVTQITSENEKTKNDIIIMDIQQDTIIQVTPRSGHRRSIPESDTSIPEFLRVQLNPVDSKPLVNVVLSTVTSNGTPSPTVSSTTEENKVKTNPRNFTIVPIGSTPAKPIKKPNVESVQNKRPNSYENVILKDRKLSENISEENSKESKPINKNEKIPVKRALTDSVIKKPGLYENFTNGEKFKDTRLTEKELEVNKKTNEDKKITEPLSKPNENNIIDKIKERRMPEKDIEIEEKPKEKPTSNKDEKKTNNEPIIKKYESITLAEKFKERRMSEKEIDQEDKSNEVVSVQKDEKKPLEVLTKRYENITLIEKKKERRILDRENSDLEEKIFIVNKDEPTSKRHEGLSLAEKFKERRMLEKDVEEKETEKPLKVNKMVSNSVFKEEDKTKEKVVTIIRKDEFKDEKETKVAKESGRVTQTARKFSFKEVQDRGSEENLFLRRRSLLSREEQQQSQTPRKEQDESNVVVLRRKPSRTSNDCETDAEDSSSIARKRSLPRGGSIGPDDEPELMKVFARRSLKLKDSECEAVAVAAAATIAASSNSVSKSRDSDKENEEEVEMMPREKKLSNGTPLEPVETSSNFAERPSTPIASSVVTNDGGEASSSPVSVASRVKRIQAMKEQWEARAQQAAAATGIKRTLP